MTGDAANATQVVAMVSAIVGPSIARSVAFGGLSTEQEMQLTSILQEKGLPPDQVSQRILSAVKKIGPQAIAQALSAPKAWQARKAIANKPSTVMKRA